MTSIKTPYLFIISHFKHFVNICTIFLLSILLVTPVSAISESMLDMFDQNHIYYYDPTGSYCEDDTAYGNYNGVPTAGLTALQAAFIDQYHDIAASLGREYGIPWEAVIAQGIIESASGTSRFARERNNFFGLGAVDSNPNQAYSYPTPAAGWRGYFDFIQNNPRYRQHGAFNYPGDPYGYIQAIKNAGYATDINYVSKVSTYIKAIEKRSIENHWSHSGSSATGDDSPTNPDDSTSVTTGIGSSNCVSDGSLTPGNGNINDTAILLSWPDRTHSPDDPKPIYKTALATTGVNRLGDSCSMAGKSCDAFVATVLRYSGADPNVPCCGANRMLNYFASHPDLYQEIPNTGSTANLQPGDIRSKPSHVEIYVVVNGQGKIASASHCDRTADHYDSFYRDSSYRIFRKK